MSDNATLLQPSAPSTDVSLERELASLFVQALNLEIAAEDIDPEKREQLEALLKFLDDPNRMKGRPTDD